MVIYIYFTHVILFIIIYYYLFFCQHLIFKNRKGFVNNNVIVVGGGDGDGVDVAVADDVDDDVGYIMLICLYFLPFV